MCTKIKRTVYYVIYLYTFNGCFEFFESHCYSFEEKAHGVPIVDKNNKSTFWVIE